MEDHFILANRSKKEFVCPCCTGDIVNPWGLMTLWLSTRTGKVPIEGRPDWLEPASVRSGRWHGDVVEALDASHDAYRRVLYHYLNVSQDAIEDWIDHKGISIPVGKYPS
jgi:hypothetical protein